MFRGNQFFDSTILAILFFFGIGDRGFGAQSLILTTGESTALIGTTLNIQGIATSEINPIVKVSAFLNGVKAAEVNTNGNWVNFVLPVSSGIPGDYQVTVAAQDSQGGVINAQPLIIHFATRAGIRIIGVKDQGVVTPGEQVTIVVEPDLDFGTLKQVYFFLGSGATLIDSTSPFEITWRPESTGIYNLSITPWLSAGPLATTNLLVGAGRFGVPLITRQPEGGMAPLGATWWFQVTAFSQGETHFQWFKNGDAIPGATNSLFTISSVQAGDVGNYYAQIDNYAGRTVSSAIELPLLNGGGGGLVLFSNQGNGLNAPITPYSSPPMTAQLWAGPSMETMIAVSPKVPITNSYFSGGTISLPNVGPGAKAFIQVFAEESQQTMHFGKSKILEITTGTSTGAPLVGLEAFKLRNWDDYDFRAYREANTLNEIKVGESASLKVIARGLYIWTQTYVTNVSYQWKKNGEPIAGAINNTLVVSNATLSDAGSYSVIATDGVEVSKVEFPLAVENAARLELGTNLEFVVHVKAGARYSVERSTDLETWVLWKSVNALDDVEVFAPPPEKNGNVYYRVVLEP